MLTRRSWEGCFRWREQQIQRLRGEKAIGCEASWPSSDEDSMFPVQGSQVRSLVGEPRFCMPLSTREEREKGCSRSRGGGREPQGEDQ